MKTLFRALGTVGLASLVIYLMRNRLLPPPVIEPGPSPIRGVPLQSVPDSNAPPPDAAAPEPADVETPAASTAPAATHDDLTEVAGIGPVYADRLRSHGIASYADLATASAEDLATATGARPATATAWIAEAERLRGSG